MKEFFTKYKVVIIVILIAIIVWYFFLRKKKSSPSSETKSTGGLTSTGSGELITDDSIIAIMKEIQSQKHGADNVKLAFPEAKIRAGIKTLSEKEKQFTKDYLTFLNSALKEISKLDKKDAKYQEKVMQIAFNPETESKLVTKYGKDFSVATKQKLQTIFSIS